MSIAAQPDTAAERPQGVEVVVLGRVGPAAARDEAHERAEVVFRLHYGPLAGWIRRMTGDDHVAHDIAAEAFVRLLARWDRVDEPRAYLYTTALNLIRDRWRRAERERTALHRDRPRVEDATTPAAAPELRMLVESLPRRQQQVIVLHYFADLSVDQVARTLGIAPGTVKRDLFEARAALARLLEGVR